MLREVYITEINGNYMLHIGSYSMPITERKAKEMIDKLGMKDDSTQIAILLYNSRIWK